MNRIEFYRRLQNHDWFYNMSDDQSVWRRGEAAEAELLREIAKHEELQPLMTRFCLARKKALEEGAPAEWPTFHEITGAHIAVLIDPATRSITEVEYDGDYKSIYKLIGASCFDVVRIDRDDTIFVDDEGLLNGKGMRTGFFVYGNYPQPLAGKGLVLGTDEEGESVSTQNPLQFFYDNISWVNSIFNDTVMTTPHAEVRQERGEV